MCRRKVIERPLRVPTTPGRARRGPGGAVEGAGPATRSRTCQCSAPLMGLMVSQIRFLFPYIPVVVALSSFCFQLLFLPPWAPWFKVVFSPISSACIVLVLIRCVGPGKGFGGGRHGGQGVMFVPCACACHERPPARSMLPHVRHWAWSRWRPGPHGGMRRSTLTVWLPRRIRRGSAKV